MCLGLSNMHLVLYFGAPKTLCRFPEGQCSLVLFLGSQYPWSTLLSLVDPRCSVYPYEGIHILFSLPVFHLKLQDTVSLPLGSGQGLTVLAEKIAALLACPVNHNPLLPLLLDVVPPRLQQSNSCSHSLACPSNTGER